jgi:hypothetical protein
VLAVVDILEFSQELHHLLSLAAAAELHLAQMQTEHQAVVAVQIKMVERQELLEQ